MINWKGPYVTHLINLFIFKCNYSLKWFLVSLEGKKKIEVMDSGLMLAMSLLRYVSWVYLVNT